MFDFEVDFRLIGVATVVIRLRVNWGDVTVDEEEEDDEEEFELFTWFNDAELSLLILEYSCDMFVISNIFLLLFKSL